MHLWIETHVEKQVEDVFEGFNKELFLKLAPPFPRVKLEQFDGCKVGDKVILKLSFIFFSQYWISEITKQATKPDEIYFIDKGIRLPFFLKSWQHTHIIIANDKGGSTIIDNIEYHSPFRWLDYLLYPSMWFMFWYRKPIYKKIFRKKR
jgi:ligand-binding SRPBCC domain-containing protein